MLVDTLFIYIYIILLELTGEITHMSVFFGGFGPSPTLFYCIDMGVLCLVTKYKL